MLDIAAMAQPHAVAIAPHNYNSTLVGLAATVQFSADHPELLDRGVLRQPAAGMRRDRGAADHGAGRLGELPTAPGHGIDIDVARLKARPYRDMGGKGLRQYWEEFPRKDYVAGATRTGY